MAHPSSPLRGSALAATLLLALTACDRKPTEQAKAPPPPAAPAPPGVEPPAATLAGVKGDEVPGEEVPAAQVQGRWRVIDQAGPEGAPAMIGRTLSFNDKELGWIGPDGQVEGRCAEPYFYIVIDRAHLLDFAPPFKPGWAKFRLPQADVGPMHAWECSSDDIFGPAEPASGSVFFPVGKDRLVMNWEGGSVLLLRRAPPG